MGSGGQGEVQDHRGLHVQVLQGLLRKASRGGTRLLQITGWHKDKATCLQLVMDEPPQGRAASPWRCEHPAHALQLLEWPGGCFFLTALWSVILSNPEKSGLAAIHSVAKEAILKGESR